MSEPPFTELCKEFNVHRNGCDSAEEILQDEMRAMKELVEKGTGEITIGELGDIGSYMGALRHLWDRYNTEVCWGVKP